MQNRLLPAVLVLLAATVFGQSARPSFDVASIKAVAPGDGPIKGEPEGTISPTPGNLTMRNVSLKDMILFAYGIKDHQLSGPSWLKSNRFDVAAKAGAGADAGQMRAMLQQLLAERFKLTVHRETKDLSVDTMAVGKNPPKIGSRKPEGPGSIGIDGGKMLFQNYTMAKLADYLSQRSGGRPIVDATGIEGYYDFSVQFGDAGSANPADVKRALGQAMRDGSFASSVAEQIGLKLETRKGPTEIVVVDQAERIPTEN